MRYRGGEYFGLIELKEGQRQFGQMYLREHRKPSSLVLCRKAEVVGQEYAYSRPGRVVVNFLPD